MLSVKYVNVAGLTSLMALLSLAVVVDAVIVFFFHFMLFNVVTDTGCLSVCPPVPLPGTPRGT